MILRRFMQHVREQNWFAVGLDVIVVIVGIFLGLQVQEWNEERQALARESEYLTRLIQDIDVSIERNLLNLDNMNRQVHYADSMLKSLEQCTLSDQDADLFANGLYLLGKYDPPVFVRDVIDDLQSTGNFQIIQNEELKSKITRTLAFIEQEQIIEGKIHARIMPALHYMDQHSTFNIKETVIGIELVDTSKVSFDFNSLCDDQRFARSISIIEAYTHSLVFVYEIAIETQRDIKAMIEAELERFK